MPNAQGQPTPGDPDYIAPSTSDGLINTTVSGIDVQGYTPQQAVSTRPTSVGYTPTDYIAPSESSVQSKVKAIVDEDSPLMRQAAQNARAEMNARGLINSSIAIGAGQQAVISQALPIAQQDSSQETTAAFKTSDSRNAASAFDAAAKNQASLTGAQLDTTVSMANAGAVNDARKSFTESSNRASLEKTLADLQAATQRYLQELSSQTQITTANIGANASMANAQLNAATSQAIAQLQASTQMSLAQVEAENRQQLQSNINAATMFNQVTGNIAQIQANPNLDEVAKQNAIQSQINMLNEALRTTGGISGLDLGQYFNDETVFNGGGAGPNSPEAVRSTANAAVTIANGVTIPASMQQGAVDQMRINLERDVEAARIQIPIWEAWDWRRAYVGPGPNESERAAAWFTQNQPIYVANHRTATNALNDFNRLYPSGGVTVSSMMTPEYTTS